jgi:very-short-patch-repair endonuclease
MSGGRREVVPHNARQSEISISTRPTQGSVVTGERYFVLRFLAEDVGKELDCVLETILTALDRQRS